MKPALVILHWLLSFFILVPASATPVESDGDLMDPLHFTVDHVDLQRYVGKWYEVARIPASFERQCAGGTTAEYKILDERTIEVKNSCITKKNQDSVSEGRGRVMNRDSNAELKVTFVDVFGKWFYWLGGRYEIIGLAPDYRWVVVGNRNLKYGWILSRTPEMTAEDFHDTLSILEQKGYNVCLFVRTPQAQPYPAVQVPVCE